LYLNSLLMLLWLFTVVRLHTVVKWFHSLHTHPSVAFCTHTNVISHLRHLPLLYLYYDQNHKSPLTSARSWSHFYRRGIDQRWTVSHFLDSAPVSFWRLFLLRLRKILKHQLHLQLTLRNLPSNLYQKDSVDYASWGKCCTITVLPFIEHDWLKWSRDNYRIERGNTLGFRAVVPNR